MTIREVTKLSLERAAKAVEEVAGRLSFPGEMIGFPPIECGNAKGVWLVTVCWEKEDHRRNRFSQVIVFLVWGDEDGRPKMRPYFQEGPCVSVNATSLNYFPDHDGMIHLQLSVERTVRKEFDPPWLEDE